MANGSHQRKDERCEVIHESWRVPAQSEIDTSFAHPQGRRCDGRFIAYRRECTVEQSGNYFGYYTRACIKYRP